MSTKPITQEDARALQRHLADVLAWYAELPQPGLVPEGAALSARLREARETLKRIEGVQTLPPLSASIRAQLIKAGVANLKEFGYPSVTASNILTDDIFKRFFKSMLEDNLGKGSAVHDEQIKQLLKEVS